MKEAMKQLGALAVAEDASIYFGCLTEKGASDDKVYLARSDGTVVPVEYKNGMILEYAALRHTSRQGLKIGDRVTVHQYGLNLTRTKEEGLAGIRRLGKAPCDTHSHWESRIVGWSGLHRCWRIACGKTGECNSDWSYSEDCADGAPSLTPSSEQDWLQNSPIKPGMFVHAKNPVVFHLKENEMVEALVLGPHIEDGAWRIGFEPTNGGHWSWMKVLRESEFRI